MDKLFESNLPILRMGSLSSHEIEEVIGSFLNVLDTDYVDSHRQTVAQTFDALLSQIQNRFQNVEAVPTSMMENVLTIFSNIEHIPSVATEEEGTDGSICLLKFLSFLKQHNNVGGDGDFTDLSQITDVLSIIAEDLEQIRFLFDYRVEDNLLFPIDKLLVGIINNAQFLQQNRKVNRRDYYALKLAVRFFKKDTDGDRIVSKIREDSNLKFIDYLNPDSILIDTPDMLNYQKNGVMVFWNSSTKRVLIRSDRETYFNQNIPVSFEVDHEWTKDHQVKIGSFVELTFAETDMAVSVSDIMKTLSGRRKVIELFFSTGRNIFLPCAVRESEDGKLYPMNPFTEKDSHIIKDNKSFPKSNIRQAFVEYYNLALEVSRINIMNRVCIGTLAMLTELDDSCWECLLEPYDQDSFYQNQMIQRWMRATNANACEQLVRDYYQALRYCQQGMEKIREHEVKGQFVLPLKNDVRYIVSFLNSVFEQAESVDIVEGVISEGSEGRCVIIQGSGECRYFEHVLDPDDILTIVESSSAYFIDCNGELYVYEQSVVKPIFGLKIIFNNCLDFDAAKRVSSVRFKHIKEAINLHRKALVEITENVFPDGEEFFEDQVYYRLVHNMVGYGVNVDKVEDYLDTIEGHQLLSFLRISEDQYFKMNDCGCLYVPKDYYAADAVLSMIYDTYLKQQSVRNEFNLYDDRIEIRNGKYYRNGYEIKKIILLLDNFEYGSAAINCIAAYFDISTEDKELTKKIDSARSRIQCYFFDDGENRVEIKLNTILNKNACKLEVHAYYGTEAGTREIEQFLEDHNIPHEATSYTVEIREKIGNIKKTALSIWPKRSFVNDNAFAVVREFNMTKVNIFPDEMMMDAHRAVTLFIKKEEKPVQRVTENDIALMQIITIVTDFILDNQESDSSEFSVKLSKMANIYDNRRFLLLNQKIRRKQLNRDNSDVFNALIELGKIALTKYFREKNSYSQKTVNTALTIVSTLPPIIRIDFWNCVVESNHEYIFLDKLIKAYAKNDQMADVTRCLKEWTSKNFIDLNAATILEEQANMLHKYKSQLPIAEDMKNAKKNYDVLMKTVNRDTDVDSDFIAIMDMLYGNP